jgi:FG-GAP repeat
MTAACILASLLFAAEPKGFISEELQPPTHVQAGGQPLDVQRDGHSAPFVGDFDGDGVQDLLVGQYDEGRLRIYRNSGSNSAPILGGFEWLKAGGQNGRVPEG